MCFHVLFHVLLGVLFSILPGPAGSQLRPSRRYGSCKRGGNDEKPFMMLGWRNLWRQKRRSLVVILSITIGVLLMLLPIAIMNGMISQMLDNNISTKLGHIAISRKGFFDDMKLESNFFPDRRILEKSGKERTLSPSRRASRPSP